MRLFNRPVILILLLSGMLSPVFAHASQVKKKTVCSITINSDNEIETFKKHLSKKDFDFIELTSLDEENWLSQACKQKITCDILVVSGHFGGSFFGSTGKGLALEELEGASCNRDCDGILSQPKEVFLFGCNTLAGKDKDSRSPEEYRRVLLQDGFSTDQAEQVVAFRYSPLGHSFHDRMSRVFSNVKNIYGFNSISPSGKNAQPLLKKYLNQHGNNYFNYLNDAKTDFSKDLLSSFKSTAMVKTEGESKRKSLKINSNSGNRPVCFLGDKNIENLDKLVWIDSVIRNPNTQFLLENIFYIKKYISDLIDSKSMTTAEESVFNRLSHSQEGKNKILSLLNRPLTGLMILQINLLEFAQSIDWLSEGLFKDHLKKILNLKQIVKNPITLEFLDSIGSVNHLDLSQSIEYSDIPHQRWSEKNFITLLDYLNIQDPKIHQALVNILINHSDPEIRLSAVSSLRELHSQNPKIQNALIQALINDTDSNVRSSVAMAITEIKPQDTKIHKVLAQVLISDSNPEVRGHMAFTLDKIKSQDPEIHNALAESAIKDSAFNVRYYAISALEKIAPHDPKTHQILTQVFINDSNTDVMYKAYKQISDLKPQDSTVRQMLVQALINNKNSSMRYNIAILLGELKPQDLETSLALAHVLINDRDPRIRTEAANAIGNIKPQDPKIHLALAQVLINDKEVPKVKENAAVALKRIDPSDPETCHIIKNLKTYRYLLDNLCKN